MRRVAALLTCHERRDTTLACLSYLARQEGHGTAVEVFLTDAGSRDGTAAAVRERFPEVTVIERGPELFWNSGMRVSWHVARGTRPDAYLWLNDDTHLDPDALARLVRVWDDAGTAIVAGSTRDPGDGHVTYGGVRRRHRLRPLRFSRVQPDPAAAVPVETVHGNCVLVPAAVAERVGNLDPNFTHGMGDFDYGLRARRAGIEVLLAPGTFGTCARNEAEDRGPREELAHLRGVKGLPPAEWRAFARRWAGPVWPLYFVSPYVRRVLDAARSTPD